MSPHKLDVHYIVSVQSSVPISFSLKVSFVLVSNVTVVYNAFFISVCREKSFLTLAIRKKDTNIKRSANIKNERPQDKFQLRYCKKAAAT